MSSVFLVQKRPAGDETKKFLCRLQPILYQLRTSNILLGHHVSSLFSILTDRALPIASSLAKAHTNTHSVLLIWKECPFSILTSRLENFVIVMLWHSTLKNRPVKVPFKHSLHHSTILVNITWIFQLSWEAASASSNAIEVYSGTHRGVRQSTNDLFLAVKSSTFAEVLKTAASNLDQRSSSISF